MPPRKYRQVALAVALGAALAAAQAAVAAAQTPEVVTRGLANPRGLTVGPDDRLYVAEAGRGGSGRCIPSPEGGAGSCYGATGAITRVNPETGRKTRVLRRLPSHAVEGGGNATGPHDISFAGDTGYFTVGLGANPAARARLGAPGRRFAALYRWEDGRVRRVADLGAYERRNNPDDGQPTAEVDSNPYSVDATRPGQILVTDAGGNTLLAVNREGEVSTVSVFPFGQALAPPFLNQPPGTQIPYQPVPTGVVRSEGRIYVGQLTGFPFPVAGANVYRLRGGARAVQARNFTTITDVAAAPDGTLYVLQISTNGIASEDPGPGKLFHIARDGQVTEVPTGALVQPTGLTVAPGGDVYIANNGGSATAGQIVRVSRDH
ncbi:MAG TPA: ScyD/ScyE family protein [Solirubrobacteraceae bacterium]|nr:ScyD/ScyE family protein [Solirubrobacteraceae bacterium]